MSEDGYTTVIKITGPHKNAVESFLNDLSKRAAEGRRVYGVDLSVERVREEGDIQEGFE